MRLFQVVQAVTEENIRNNNGALVTALCTEMLMDTRREFRSHDAFESYAREHGDEFAGGTYELWSDRGKSARMRFEEVTQYRMVIDGADGNGKGDPRNGVAGTQHQEADTVDAAIADQN